MASTRSEQYVEAVLALVEQVPPGRVTTYGAVADALGRDLGRGGPRQVGSVMATWGGGVPWWRVIRSDGTVPAHLGPEALQCWWSEGTPLRPSGRVDLAAAFWAPTAARGEEG
ncbi:MGMT family protein [Nocardioides sp. HDW12B]|uniref:MGMT family protein n=1 Tax=Nocardioides sp. HDW12B TaxID=2714939 RepID=UPI001408E90B|nr:MGMT family protein [Nocardioides sp. HDW12B]QIK67415.1 MGMT family protein [Nocardioides sp. HDW12B]